MKTKIFIAGALIATVMHGAYAGTCSRAACGISGTPTMPNCKRAEWVCATNGSATTSSYASCVECVDGYEEVENVKVYEKLTCTGYSAKQSMITHVCREQTCGSDCVSTAWVSPLGGYQARSVKECVNGVCQSSSEFRCNTGYYGSPTQVGSGCTRCPQSSGTYGTTAGPGTATITSCFLEAGTAFADTTGSGTYTAKCPWTY